jgi:hypothetical protein
MNTNEALKLSIALENLKRANETPRLEDFTSEQLTFAQILFKKARREAIENATALRGMYSEENERTRFWDNEAETATMWMTQIMNALRKVHHTEQIKSN